MIGSEIVTCLVWGAIFAALAKVAYDTRRYKRVQREWAEARERGARAKPHRATPCTSWEWDVQRKHIEQLPTTMEVND